MRFAIGSLLLALITTACAGPGKPASTVDAPGAGKQLLQRLAAILRAEDRRVADESLWRELSAPEPEMRSRAILALARIGDPQARPHLEAALSDPSPQVRSQAAVALGLLGDRAAAPALTGGARDPDAWVRTAAAVALGWLGAPAAAEPLRILLEDADPVVQARAALATARLEDPHFAVGMLINLSSSGDRDVQSAAAYALGRLGAASATAKIDDETRRTVREHLLSLADDPNPLVRMQVARGLAAPSLPAETKTLDGLIADPDRRVRLAAIRSMSYPGVQIEGALRLSLKDPDSYMGWTLMEGMGRIGGRRATSILSDRIAKGRSPWVREQAILSLNRTNRSVALGRAVYLSQESNARLRAAAAAVLAGSERPEARGVASNLLKDPDPNVRAAAVPAVAGISGSLSEKLGEVIESPEPLLRAAVARAAGQRLALSGRSEVEVEEAFRVLRRLWELSESDPQILARQAVLDAVVRFGRDDRVRQLLELALENPDRRIRLLAIRHLAEVFGEDRADRAAPAPDLPLEHYVKILRWAQRPRAAIITMERPGFKPGRFTIVLDTKAAPLTSWKFARLAEEGFYDGLGMQRVVPNFVVQVEEPGGNGPGGLGYAVRDEIYLASFRSGTMAMASSGRDLAGGQWFITLTPQPHLERRYTAFGHVVQNLRGVVSLLEPGDRVVSIRMYEGDGTEPLPPLE